MHRICGIFLAVSETLNDILKSDLSGKMIEYVFLLSCCKQKLERIFGTMFFSSLCVMDFDSQRDSDEVVTENDLRKKRLASRDVVYTVDLVNLFRNEVTNLRGCLGDVAFNDAMSTVDAETLAMAKTFLE